MTTTCPVCMRPIAEGEVTVNAHHPFADSELDLVAVHKRCAELAGAEGAIAAGDYSPSEDYPHGDF